MRTLRALQALYYLPYHRHTDRPRSVPNGQLQIRIVCLAILALLHMVHDLGNPCQNVRLDVLRMDEKATRSASLSNLPASATA